MARMVLEQAFPPDWIYDVFETHRRCQYARELLFSTVVGLMTLVVLGLRPSLHAAARRSENLPVSLTALYDKVTRGDGGVIIGAAACDDLSCLPQALLRYGHQSSTVIA